MLLEKKDVVIKRSLSRRGIDFEELPINVRISIVEAMLNYAEQAVNKEEKTDLFFKSWWMIPERITSFLVWKADCIIRNINAKIAQERATIEGYKTYLLREKRFRYKILSTADFKYNKKIRVLKNEITAKDMERLACAVKMPKK